MKVPVSTRLRPPRRRLRIWSAGLIWLMLLLLPQIALAANPPPVQTFYIPLPEDQILQSLTSIYPGGSSCPTVVARPSNPINTYVSISIISNDTIVYYDHWEDGFEVDISNPQQSTTQIWGDGNAANGSPPGIPNDLLTSDTVVVLENDVNSETLQSVIDFDGGDRVSASRLVAMTRAAWATGSETLLAGAVEVYDTFKWGQSFQAPVGENVDTGSQIFEYTGVAVMAARDGTVVQIDRDANGSVDTTVTLNQGQSYLQNGSILAGATVNASAPVQVAMITGDRCDVYESRWYVLFPSEQWSNSYYNPVGTPSGDGTRVFLYNPNNATQAVDWETAGGAPQPQISVPARGSASVTVPDGSGAHFRSVDSSKFVAIAAVAATGGPGFNSRADWGFSLVPEDQLTTQILVGWGPGRDPTSAVNPNENGSPVWVTPVLPPGGTGPVDVCVDFDGNGAGPLTDAFGFRYDLRLSLNELESRKVFDVDGDQTGMVLYVCDLSPQMATARIVAAWGQAPGIASAAAPGLDLGTTAPPASTFGAGKAAQLSNDRDGDTLLSPGDRLRYDIIIRNTSRVPINSVIVSDTIPARTTYVNGSTTFNNGTTTAPIADNGTGTSFPLDNGGVTLTNLPVRGVFTVTFEVDLDATFPAGENRVRNVATVQVGREVAMPEVESPVDLDPAITIQKSTNGTDSDTPPGLSLRVGSPVTWSYQISNPGVVTLTGVIVTDSVPGISPVYVSGDNGNNILDINESWTFRATGSVVAGQYANVGGVRATAADGDVAFATDPSHYFGVRSSIAVSKNSDRPVIVAGDRVTYTISVSNTGNVALSNVLVSDDRCSPVTFIDGDGNGDSRLDLGELWRYQCSTTLNADTTNTVSVSGTDTLGDQVTANDVATVSVINPALALAKSPSASTVLSGTQVTYSYTVTNPGDVPMNAISVVDDRCSPVAFGGGDDNTNGSIDVGESWRYSCSTVLTTDTTNRATVTGNDPLGNPHSAAASAFVDVINPGIRLEKNVSDPIVISTTVVTYTISLLNTGDVPLTNVAVSDDRCSPLIFSSGDNGNSILDLNERWIYTCSRALTEDTTNRATAAVTDPLGNVLNAEASATVDVINPSIGVTKSVTPTVILAGSVVSYTYAVNNAGDVPLSNVTLTDDTCSPVTRTGGDANSNNFLDVGEVWQYFCSTTVNQDTTNTVTARAFDPLGNPLRAAAQATVDVIAPAIAITKSGSSAAVLPGTSVTYSYTVTNTGDVPLGNLAVSDDRCSPVAFLGGDANSNSLLDLTEIWTYRCTVVVNLETVNTATVNATDPLGNPVSAQDTFRVILTVVYLPIIGAPAPPPIPCPPPDGCPINGVDRAKGLAVNESSDRLYVTSQGNNQLLVLNPQNQTTAQAETGPQPWGVVVDEARNRIYIANNAGSSVWVYQSDTLEVLAKIALPGQPSLLAILPGIDTVFAVMTDRGSVGVIRNLALAEEVNSGGESPYGIAVDTTRNIVFLSNRSSAQLTALVADGGSWRLERGPRFEDGRRLFEIAYNPQNNKLYVVYADATSNWFIDVWKPDLGQQWGPIRTGIPVGSGGSIDSPSVGGTGIEVNPSTNALFNLNTAASSMTVINGVDNGIRDTIGLGNDPFAIAINSKTNVVYIALRTPGRLVKINDTY